MNTRQQQRNYDRQMDSAILSIVKWRTVRPPKGHDYRRDPGYNRNTSRCKRARRVHIGIDLASRADKSAYWHNEHGEISREHFEALSGVQG